MSFRGALCVTFDGTRKISLEGAFENAKTSGKNDAFDIVVDDLLGAEAEVAPNVVINDLR